VLTVPHGEHAVRDLQHLEIAPHPGRLSEALPVRQDAPHGHAARLRPRLRQPVDALSAVRVRVRARARVRVRVRVRVRLGF